MILNSFLLTDQAATVIIDGQTKSIRPSHENFSQVIEELSSESPDPEELSSLLDVGKSVEAFFSKNITIEGGAVLYKGRPVNNYCADKALQFMRENLPYKALLLFLDGLLENSSQNSVQQLYPFLEHEGITITPDGCFVAYKGVTSDFKDCHTKTIDNSVGQIVTMERNEVCDDPDKGCHVGLHCGSLNYARGYSGAGGHVVLVKVHPKDVVSVPSDSSYQKCRTCAYEVIGVHEDDGETREPLQTFYYGSSSEDDYDDGEDWEGEDWQGENYSDQDTSEKLSRKAKGQKRSSGKFSV